MWEYDTFQLDSLSRCNGPEARRRLLRGGPRALPDQPRHVLRPLLLPAAQPPQEGVDGPEGGGQGVGVVEGVAEVARLAAHRVQAGAEHLGAEGGGRVGLVLLLRDEGLHVLYGLWKVRDAERELKQQDLQQ